MKLFKLPISFLLFTVTSLTLSKSWGLYTPNEGLKDLLSEELTYVGKYIPSYSASGKFPACIFRNSKVLVKYQYCVGYTIQAAQVTIHSVNPEKGFVKIYAEGDGDIDVSQMTRKDYFNELWYVDSAIDDPNFNINMTLAGYQKYDKLIVTSNSFDGCVTSGNLTNFPNQTYCYPNHPGQVDIWGQTALEFWKDPGQTWYDVLKLMKTKVPKVEEAALN
ncbi:MAG: hypothetical protein V4736_11585 [Bdellovibrionota bacterium]